MEELAEVALGTEPDGSIWLAVSGNAMRPLLARGDAGRFQPCDSGALAPGDIVLVRRASVWMIRLVTSTAPLTTSLLRGPATPEYGVVHGRMIARRSGGRVRAYRNGDRRRALLLRLLLGSDVRARLRASASYRRLRNLPRAMAAFPPLRALRASRIGAVNIRALLPADEDALLDFAHAWLPHLADLFQRQLPARWQQEGFALGAFTRSGNLVGFVFLDEYTQEGVELDGMWVRALKVIPDAQRLHIGSRLIAALRDEAAARGHRRIFADINATNDASLRLFRGLGFRDCTAAMNEKLNREFGDRQMVAVELEPG